MNGRDCTIFGICHQDRQAVGGSDRERKPRDIGDQSVPLAEIAGVPRNDHAVRMNLTNGG